MFFISSLIVSTIALFRSSILPYIGFIPLFMLVFKSVISCMPSMNNLSNSSLQICPLFSVSHPSIKSTNDLIFRGSRSSTSPGAIMKFRISPLSLHKIEFETVEPSQRTLSALRYVIEYIVYIYALAEAHPLQDAVNKTDARAFAPKSFVNGKAH